MAEPLKNFFSKDFILSIADEMSTASKDFNKSKFVKSVLDEKWNSRELKDRMNHTTHALNESLPLSYDKQIKVINKIAPKFNGFTATVFPNFVEKYGQDNYAISIESLAYLTQFSTSEFAIRPFLKSRPETIEIMYDWAKDKNFHVRRLSSEGCRPLLPWAMKLDQYVKDPKPILPILEKLKNDKEDYVYRSVANNLNDISKHHPELILSLAEKWIGNSATTDRVLKHALRTLLKKGNPTSMNLFGFGPIGKITIDDFYTTQKELKIGESTQLIFKFSNKGKSAKFRFEYVVYYLKKNGSYSPKVFQISEKNVAENEAESFTKKIDFKDLTTRKHYQGLHYIGLKINGVEQKKIEILLK